MKNARSTVADLLAMKGRRQLTKLRVTARIAAVVRGTQVVPIEAGELAELRQLLEEGGSRRRALELGL